MSAKKALVVALAGYLPVFGAIFGVTLFGVATYFDNVTMFFLSIVIFSVLPPILEEVGHSLKEKYEMTQNEVDIIAMIPEWSLGYEMLASIAIMIVSAVLRNFVVFYLGAWLLCLGGNLGMAKEINGLKEDLRSSDLEKRRTAKEKVEQDEQIGAMTAGFLVLIGFLIFAFGAMSGSLTLAEAAIIIVMLFASLIPGCVVCEQAKKVMPPEPEKAARAAS